MIAICGLPPVALSENPTRSPVLTSRATSPTGKRTSPATSDDDDVTGTPSSCSIRSGKLASSANLATNRVMSHPERSQSFFSSSAPRFQCAVTKPERNASTTSGRPISALSRRARKPARRYRHRTAWPPQQGCSHIVTILLRDKWRWLRQGQGSSDRKPCRRHSDGASRDFPLDPRISHRRRVWRGTSSLTVRSIPLSWSDTFPDQDRETVVTATPPSWSIPQFIACRKSISNRIEFVVDDFLIGRKKNHLTWPIGEGLKHTETLIETQAGQRCINDEGKGRPLTL